MNRNCTASGAYYHSYFNEANCPSVDTLYLIVNYSRDSMYDIIVCDSFIWHVRNSANTFFDTVYNASGCYYHKFTTAQGCIGTDTLNLTVYHNSNTAYMAVACDSNVWTIGDSSYTQRVSGIYYHSYLNDNGCPSVDTLYLTIKHSTYRTETFDVCDSLRWTNGALYTTSNATDTMVHTNAAGCDSIVTLSLTVRHSTDSTCTYDVCDSLRWTAGNDSLYTATTTTDTIHRTNAAGCDSIVTLNLTVRRTMVYIDVRDVCDSLRWTNGTLYTADNHTDTIHATAHNGCDSLVSLDLIVRRSTASTDTHDVCDSLRWANGILYTADNSTDTMHLANVAGCDSLVTLSLTVRHSSTATYTKTACNGYIWHGMTFSASTDTATYTTTNASGCDSTVTLDITINQCSITELTVCDSTMWHSTTYSASGTYADGTDTLLLTVNHSNSSTVTVTACDSLAWHGRTFTASTDTATHTATNAAGCDSTTTLHLTIAHDTTTVETRTACFQLMWHDTLCTESSTYIHYDTTAQGCRQTDTLHLTVYADSSTAYTVSDTGSYTWVNHDSIVTYTESGTYLNSYTTTDGCNSVDTLRLTIIIPTEIFTVQVHSANARMGWASINGSSVSTLGVAQGGRCIIRANAYNGYRFVRWNNGATANPYTITVTQDTMLIAIFEGKRYAVTVVNGTPGRGVVTGSGQVQHGSRRNISASPVTGYLFSRWNDGDTNASRTVTVTRDTTFTAYFDIRRYSIEVLAADSSQGTVSGGGSYDYLDYATLNATPANGYAFGHWSDGDSTNPRRLQVRGDSTLTAYFVPGIRRYTLTVTSGNAAAGSVSGSGTYDEGTAVVISARAATGYEFVQWNDSVTSNPRTVTINSDTLFTAAFREIDVPDTFTVTATSNDGGMGRVSGGGRYEEGSRVQLNAYPSARCHFMRWSDGNSDNPRNITVDRDISLTALFAHDSVTITLRANDDRMGTVTGGGIYPVDATATITATPNSGYRFVCWSTGEAANPHSFTVRYAATYTAIFESTATEGIDEADGTAVRVWGSDRTIHITGLNGGPLRVYDITGRTVAERNAATGSIAITVAYPGLYMVHTCTATHKVLIR